MNKLTSEELKEAYDDAIFYFQILDKAAIKNKSRRKKNKAIADWLDNRDKYLIYFDNMLEALKDIKDNE